MQSLSKKEDIDKTLSLFEQRTQNISIPKDKTPWFILSPDFVTGYRHWIQLSNGNKIPVPCKGGNEGKGFAVNECPYCAKSLEYYRKGKRLLQQGKEKSADKAKEAGNSIRATFSALFHAVKGAVFLEKKTTKNGIKKVLVPYFEDVEVDGDSDAENKVEVGILSLSQAQFENFTGMISSDEYPFIQSGDDLCNRVIWTQKKKSSKKKRFPEVVFSADKNVTERPDVTIPEDQQDLEAQFVISDEEFENIWRDFSGDVSAEMEKREKKRTDKKKKKPVVVEEDEDDDDDEEEDDEDEEEVDDDDDDDDDSEDDDDDDEDDDDDDDDDSDELPDDAYLDDDEDDFEDDDPDDEPPKKSVKKSTDKKAGKSGKVKL